MLRFNLFWTVVLTFFAFLMAFGGGLLSAIRLTTPEELAPPARIQQEMRRRPGHLTRERAALVLPLENGDSLDLATGMSFPTW
jgi:hypothetical protein